MAGIKYKNKSTGKWEDVPLGNPDAYTPTNPPPYPVRSVNGKTGAVTGLYDANNPPPYPVRSVNGKTGAVTGLYDADNPPPQKIKSAVVTLQKDDGFGGYVFPSSFPQKTVSKFISAYFETLPTETTSTNNIFIFGRVTDTELVGVIVYGLALDVSSNTYTLTLWTRAASISVRVYYEE